MKATARRRRPSRSPIPYRNISRRLRSNQSHRRRVRRSKAAPWYAQCRRVWRRGEGKIMITTSAQQAGTLKNLVVPGGPGGPSDPIGPGGNASCAPNECETTTEVQAPKLLAIKTANKSVAEIGDAVQYTIEVKNLGHGAVEGV